jgi:ABC-type uncharacterized transport system substrate-binding protein
MVVALRKTLLILALTGIGCPELTSAMTAHAQTANPRIGIVYTAPHPVINDIIAGFKEAILRSYPGAVFTERHAKGVPSSTAPRFWRRSAQTPRSSPRSRRPLPSWQSIKLGAEFQSSSWESRIR